MNVWQEIVARLGENIRGVPVPDSPWLVIGVSVAIVIVVVPPLWLQLRQIVTVVHELGHAMVGISCGRRFTGFVVNSDMSGHTLTSGKPRGIGIVLTMLAGYPMPAIVGAVVIFAALGGRAGLVLVIAFLLMLVALLRSKSLYTVTILVLLMVGVVAVWWTNAPELSATIVTAAGVVLLVGAWRQFGAVIAHGGGQSDLAQLARITRVPRLIWVAFMAVPIGLSTWWAAGEIFPSVSGALN